MHSSKSGGRSFLQCPTRHYSKDACSGAFISVERLERAVVVELNRLTAEYLDRESLERGIAPAGELVARQKQLMADISNCEKRLCECSISLRALYLDKLKGVISESDFVELSGDFASQRERINERIRDHKRELDDIKERLALESDRHSLVGKFVNVERLTREMVEILIDKIVVGKRIEGTRNVPIEIHWNF